MNRLALFLLSLVLASSCVYFLPRPDLASYEPLRTPRIVERASEKVLQATLKGDPNKTAGKAIEAIMRGYYSLDQVDKSKFRAPKARWVANPNTPRDEWVGIFAMTVPDSVTQAPKSKVEGVELTLAQWEYGVVGEVLHQGDYEVATDAVEKLKSFVETKGYALTGNHEEEYILGPGSPGEKGPSSWLTVVRYQLIQKLQ